MMLRIAISERPGLHGWTGLHGWCGLHGWRGAFWQTETIWRIRIHVRFGLVASPQNHRWPSEHGWRTIEDGGRAPAGLDQLIVELMRQEALKREVGGTADARADGGQQHHLGDQQPNPQRPRARQPELGARHVRLQAQRAGLRTYPAPRNVWIIGSRPLSIFLRRYDTYSSTMLDRPPKS